MRRDEIMREMRRESAGSSATAELTARPCGKLASRRHSSTADLGNWLPSAPRQEVAFAPVQGTRDRTLTGQEFVRTSHTGALVPGRRKSMSDPGLPPEEQRIQPVDRSATERNREARPDAGSSPSDAAAKGGEASVASASAFPGAELLASGTAKEVLERILVGDPLGVVDRARAWLDTHAFLIDSNRLGLRAMAHAAHSARRYRGKPDLHTWLELLMERSVKELVDEDREDERNGVRVVVDEVAPYAFIADALGIESALARRACVIFNGMVEYDRQVFYATSVLGKSMHRHVSEGFGPPARAEAALQRVLRRLNSIEGMPGSGT